MRKAPVTQTENPFYGSNIMKTAVLNIRQTMKGENMKKTILAAVMAVSMCLLFSDAVPAQSRNDNKGAPGMRNARERPGDAASLTEEQKATVKSILSKYKASTLTADDAKAIHGAFRDAGVRGGPGLNEAVRSAGFDSEKLRDLDPPPDMKACGETDPEDRKPGRKSPGKGIKEDRQ
jgi:hypothetical protein